MHGPYDILTTTGSGEEGEGEGGGKEARRCRGSNLLDIDRKGE